MDFALSNEQQEAAKLAAEILKATCASETHKEVAAANGDRFSSRVWTTLAEAGLLALSLPEEFGGSGLGFSEACSVFIEVGRQVAPAPVTTHVVASLAIAEFGTQEQQSELLPTAGSGEVLLTCAFPEYLDEAPAQPSTTAKRTDAGWILNGTKTNVIAATRADWVIIPASTDAGVALFQLPTTLLSPVEEQHVSDGDLVGQITMNNLPVSDEHLLGAANGMAHDWLRLHLTAGICALQLGTVEGALELTATYAKNREQFGRPIGTFQAVSQRLADGYIDTLGARLCLWQAVWRLNQGLDAEEAVSVAKLWAADAGHKLAHTTVHIHGGVGIDLDGEAHRYFTAAKRNEFVMGGANEQARRIGAILAS